MPRHVDLELSPHYQRAGYTAAAQWLAADADNETLVFRKFDRLAALNLLYLQSEILELEDRVNKMHHEAENGDMSAMTAARSWEKLVGQSRQGPPEVQERARGKIELIRELRGKIREYRVQKSTPSRKEAVCHLVLTAFIDEALVLQSQIAQLKHPENRVLEALRHWFRTPHPVIHGKAKEFLDNRDDLVALKSPAEVDHLSRFLRRNLAQTRERASDGSHYARFSETTVTNIVNFVTIIAAASFLLGPILGLYFLSSTRYASARLAMVVVFTAAFAVLLSVVTSAKRSEIFGATAAYAAVLVVFVSNGSLSPS